MSAKGIRSEEDMQSILSLWKLTPRVLLEPCLQMLKQMDKQAFDVSQYLSCDSISWDLTKVGSGNHIVPGPQEPGIAVSLTDLISSKSSEPPCFEGAINSSITRYPPTTLTIVLCPLSQNDWRTYPHTWRRYLLSLEVISTIQLSVIPNLGIT
jgi:hypothetical protein